MATLTRFFMFILLSALVCAGFSIGTAKIDAGVFGVMFAFLALSVVLISLAYMVGWAFGLDKLKGWAKHEIGEVIACVLILVLIKAFAVSADQTVDVLVKWIDPLGYQTLCGVQGTAPHGYQGMPCHMRVATNFVLSIFYETASFFKAIGIAYSLVSYIATFSITFHLNGIGVVLASVGVPTSFGFGGARVKVDFYSYVFSYLTKLLIILRFEEIILRFIVFALFPVLLPLGIALRGFFLTRRLGGLLIAIALALYYVFPMFFVFGDAVYYDVITYHNLAPSSINPQEGKNAIAPVVLINHFNIPMVDISSRATAVNVQHPMAVSREILNTQGLSADVCSGLAEWWKKAENPNSNAPWLENEVTDTDKVLNAHFTKFMEEYVGDMDLLPSGFKQNLYALDIVARLMFFTLTFSFLAVIGTIATIKTLSPMLGGDTELAGLTRLI